MTSLMPRRLFSDLTDWFETERPTNMIRIEDMLTEHEYLVRAELPGLDPDKNIRVEVDHGMLNIRAERREEEKTAAGHTEFRYGLLQRSVRLPGNADDEHIKASYKKGLLEVAVPLRENEPAGRQIEVATS